MSLFKYTVCIINHSSVNAEIEDNQDLSYPFNEGQLFGPDKLCVQLGGDLPVDRDGRPHASVLDLERDVVDEAAVSAGLFSQAACRIFKQSYA